MQVLSQALADSIRDRRVRVALFTTYTFDPGFFELNVLPVLFDQAFSQPDKVRRLQLEDALSKVDEVAVYYDRSALVQSAAPGRLDYRRIDVRRATGCFHPKVTLVLVDNPPNEDADPTSPPTQSLIVMVASANLTAEGWWENVECAHIEEIHDKDVAESRQAFRRDVLYFLQRIEDCAGPGENHAALDAVRTFLRERVSTEAPAYASSGGRYHTRLFYGQNQSSLSDWLASLRLQRQTWNLEVISPYFDATGARPLADLIDVLQPRETRVYLPLDADGAAQVSAEAFSAVTDFSACHWSDLHGDVVKRKGTDVPRRVHAKVYRLWNSEAQILVVGSVNLTSPGHSHAGTGNLEAAFLTDATDTGVPLRWWLERRDKAPERFAERVPTEDELASEVPLDLSIRYDWGTRVLQYRLMGDKTPFEVTEISGTSLFKEDRPTCGKWVDVQGEAAVAVRDLLSVTSLVCVKHELGSFQVLVREENMAHRPSMLTEITPEEILQWWSLLTQAQRAAFLEERAALGEELEGIPLATRKIDREKLTTVFDRFAGVYHAFGCLHRSIEDALKERRYRDAEARLVGAKHDSLPSLLAKLKKRTDADPVLQYVTFLCAQQLTRALERTQKDFVRTLAGRTAELETLLEHVKELKAQLEAQNVPADFLEWYEQQFRVRATV
jgi:hypothetical protein